MQTQEANHLPNEVAAWCTCVSPASAQAGLLQRGLPHGAGPPRPGCSPWSVVVLGSSRPLRLPTVMRPTSRVPATEALITGMWSASSASNTLQGGPGWVAGQGRRRCGAADRTVSCGETGTKLCTPAGAPQHHENAASRDNAYSKWAGTSVDLTSGGWQRR